MTNKDLESLKEKFKQLKSKRNEILEIQKEISCLEETEEIKRYSKLINIFKEKTTGKNRGFDKYTDEQLISIALSEANITPDEEIYVYMGTYKYNHETDVIHGSSDIQVNREDCSADYVRYKNLESKYDGDIEVPYTEADEFEKNHRIIILQNVANKEKYFYKLQSEYFETIIFESLEAANIKINKLIKNRR